MFINFSFKGAMIPHFILLILFLSSLFSPSRSYAQDQDALIIPEIYVTLTNPTDAEVRLNVQEVIQQSLPDMVEPYTFVDVTKLTLSPNETVTTSFLLSENVNKKRTMYITTNGGKYGQTGTWFDTDISKSYIFILQLKLFWVYPGTTVWPPLKPHLGIKANVYDSDLCNVTDMTDAID